VTATVRLARPQDGPGLYQTWQALRQHNATIDTRIVLIPVSEREFVAGFSEMLLRPTSATFIAEDEGRVVGFLSGGIEQNLPDRLPERHATVGYLFVDPRVRRQGVARRLFESMAAWAARQDGVVHMEMTVLAADAAAAGFWRSVGFTTFIERLWAPLPGAENE
jgi:GNAT superfamily N-acetyltransferase